MKNLLYKNEYINVYETDGSYLATLEDANDNLISNALYSDYSKCIHDNSDRGRIKRFIDEIKHASENGAGGIVDFLKSCHDLADDIDEVFEGMTWGEVAEGRDTDYMCKIGNYIILFR